MNPFLNLLSHQSILGILRFDLLQALRVERQHNEITDALKLRVGHNAGDGEAVAIGFADSLVNICG